MQPTDAGSTSSSSGSGSSSDSSGSSSAQMEFDAAGGSSAEGGKGSGIGRGPGTGTGSSSISSSDNRSSSSSSSSSDSDSGSSGDLRSGVLQASASMAVMLAAGTTTDSTLKFPDSFMMPTQSKLTASACMAADLLRLAAHEVAAGRAGRATLALAAAAQGLAAACSDDTPGVLQRMAKQAICQDGGILDKLQAVTELLERASKIAFYLQRLQDSLAGLRGAVEGWQQRGAAVVEGASPNNRFGVLPGTGSQEKEGQQQQQQQQTGQQLVEEQQQVEGQQLNRFRQAQQHVEQEEQQLQQRQHQERQQLKQQTLGMKQQLQQQKKLLHQQQQQAHLEQQLEQQQSAFRTIQAAVNQLTRDVSSISKSAVRLAGCSWAGCSQQHSRGMYSADAAVAGLHGVSCGGCGLARFCCPQHQQQDWPRHRHVCRRLAQARAGTGHGASSHAGSGCGA
jgi:hypothetical protein